MNLVTIPTLPHKVFGKKQSANVPGYSRDDASRPDKRFANGIRRRLLAAVLALAATSGAASTTLAADMPPVSPQTRAALDAALGAKGVYVPEESAYRFSVSRADLSVRLGALRLNAAEAPASWIVFSRNREAFVNAEFIVVADEVNAAIGAAVKAGLRPCGLGPAILTTEPLLLALNVNAEGTYQVLGVGIRRVLDEIHRVRAGRPTPAGGATGPAVLVKDAIDPNPLNATLSMRGAATDGVYRAAIGRVELVNGTPLGREMGMSTKVTIFGTNERAVLDADFIVNGDDELRRVLGAITSRNVNVSAIRNHIVGEHPDALWIRVWAQGVAQDLARSVRYVLDVAVGVAKTGE
jgi:uncharacterized protein DUF1259